MNRKNRRTINFGEVLGITEEQFNQQLKANHTTVDELKRDIRRDLTQTKVLNKEINSKINEHDRSITLTLADGPAPPTCVTASHSHRPRGAVTRSR